MSKTYTYNGRPLAELSTDEIAAVIQDAHIAGVRIGATLAYEGLFKTSSKPPTSFTERPKPDAAWVAAKRQREAECDARLRAKGYRF